MHMDQALRSGTLVQVIDILGDQQQLSPPFRIEARQRSMRGVRLDVIELRPSCIVESVDQLGIARERFRRGDVFDAMAVPQPVRSSESRKPAFGRNSGAGQNDNVADVHGNSIKRR